MNYTPHRFIRQPLSIEHIPPNPMLPSVPPLVSVNFAVVFPDAQINLDEGLLPPLAIANSLHVDLNLFDAYLYIKPDAPSL